MDYHYDTDLGLIYSTTNTMSLLYCVIERQIPVSVLRELFRLNGNVSATRQLLQQYVTSAEPSDKLLKGTRTGYSNTWLEMLHRRLQGGSCPCAIALAPQLPPREILVL